MKSGVRISHRWMALALPLLLVCTAKWAPAQAPSVKSVEPKNAISPTDEIAAEVLSIEVALSDRKLSGDGALILQDAFDLVFVNNSDHAVEIWNSDSRQGWSLLSFQLTDLATGQQHMIRRRPVTDLKRKEFTPRPLGQLGERITLRPGEEHTYLVLLSDCERSDRDWLGLPKTAYQQRFAFKARFESPPQPPQGQSSLWVGKIESPSQIVRLVDWQPQSPQYYLVQGFPQKALEILKSDRFWISKRDKEFSQTPLQIAAEENGYPEVVKWLIDNGADVNDAVLSSAENPAVIGLILAKHPDLEDSGSGEGETLLQQAARKWSRATSPEERGKWQTIMEMYRKAGAEYGIGTAIELNDLDRVKAILSKSPQLARKHEWRSPLRAAAALGRLDICRYLIERFHVDVNEFKAGSGYPIIKETLAYPEVVRLLIKSGADLKTPITWTGGRTGVWIVGDNATALHYAAEDGVPGSIQLLIDNGVDIFATADPPFSRLRGKKEDQTALDVAAIFGKADNAAAIVHHPKFQRVDPKRRQEVLDRCLTCWRWHEHSHRPVERWRLLETLLECGADPNARVNGITAIQRAAEGIRPTRDANNPGAGSRNGAENDEIRKEIDVLRKHGAQLDLVSAVAIGNEAEVARLLKQNPQSANSRRADGYPALHWAVAMNYEGIVKQLLEAGCDVGLRNECDHIGSETALHNAAFWGRFSIAKTLLLHGANVNAISTRNQWTPLHEAAYMGQVKVARLLLENGANPQAKNKDGNIPMDLSQGRWSHHKAAIHALFDKYAGTAKVEGRR
jgi:ankyrin repeat protein